MASKDKVKWHRKRHRIGDFQEWRCYYCDGIVVCPHPECCPDAPREYRATLDHVTPKSLGGGRSYANLVIACEPCNHDKDNHVLTDVQTFRFTENSTGLTYAIGTRV